MIAAHRKEIENTMEIVREVSSIYSTAHEFTSRISLCLMILSVCGHFVHDVSSWSLLLSVELLAG